MSILSAITMAFFTDGFLFGLVIPLARHFAAPITDDWSLSMSYVAYAMGVILATPLFGTLSDRFGRRKPLLWGLCFQVLSTAIFALGTTFPQLLFARVAQGAAAAATWTSGLALLAERFNVNRGQMLGIVMMGNTCGLVIGPIVGGVLLDWWGYQAPFIAATMLFCVDGLLRFICIRDPAPAERLHRMPPEKSPLRSLLTDRSVLMTSFVIVLGAASWALIEALLPGHMEEGASASASAVGTVFTLSNLLFAFCCPMLGAVVDRYGPWPAMRASLILTALMLPTLTLSDNVMVIGAVLALIGVANGLTINTTLSELADAVDRRGGDIYASAFAIYNLAHSIGMAGGDIAGGAFAAAVSLNSAFCLVAAWLLAGAILIRGFPRVPLST